MEYLTRKIAIKSNENVRKSTKLEHQKLQIEIRKICFVTRILKGEKTLAISFFRKIIFRFKIKLFFGNDPPYCAVVPQLLASSPVLAVSATDTAVSVSGSGRMQSADGALST